MIVMEQKPLNEIMGMLGGFNSLLIVGCNGCAGIYQVGGEKQAEVMKMLIEMARRIGGGEEMNTKATTVLRQCDLQIVSTSIAPLVEDYDAILSMACGVGVQTLAQAFEDKTIVPANNTKFMGMQERELGKLYEMCSACGDCILFETGGVCPVTRCAKGMMNGPCGGCVGGKCEVPYEVRDESGKVVEAVEKDCAWYLIYERLKGEGRLASFRRYRPPRNRATSTSPRLL
ncbi:MAG: methylenetetrahydrofolate reductase C-terminal domain-containing protein [Candidatus Bathyarchaeia archaeon]